MLGNLIIFKELIFFLFIQIFIYLLAIKYKSKIIIDPHLGVQNTNFNQSPRIGGIVLVFGLFVAILFFNIKSIFYDFKLITYTFIISMISLKEDIFGNVKASIRFLSLLIFSLLFAFEYKYELTFDNDLMNIIFQYDFLYILIITLSLTAFPNGLNIIDGMNGLLGFTLICILASILMISEIGIIDENKKILIILLSFLIIFLLFNFPKGYIFFGDSGCYLIGLIIGILIIDMYAANNRLSIWNLILICSYPSIEVIFSYFRKLFEKKSPFKPDGKHIHLKMYYFLKIRLIQDIDKKNYLVTLFLLPLWFFPFIFTYLVNIGVFTPKIFLLIQISIYMGYYFFIPDLKIRE